MLSTKDNNALVKEKVNILSELANALKKDYNLWVDLLQKIETKATVIDEVEKTIKALSTYSQEELLVKDRIPLGTFCVSLPYNNPIYSFILYCCGIALVGNNVIVRPSKLTNEYVLKFVNQYSKLISKLGIKVFNGSGEQFIKESLHQQVPGGLLFTGRYQNVENIIKRFPQEKKLIYCGSGICPFIVGNDKTKIEESVNLAIASKIYNSGQDCLCSERFYVHEDCYEVFCKLLIERIKALEIGDFGNPNADIFPPIQGMEQSIKKIHTDIVSHSKPLFQYISKEGAYLCVFEVPLNSIYLNTEKFCTIFTIAKYKNDHDLIIAAKSPYRFGAIVTAGANRSIWDKYPHVTTSNTVIEEESINAHIPFGGYGKSGFSRVNSSNKDGPILYSVESSKLL